MPGYQSVPSESDEFFMPDRASWRAWLAENHDKRSSVWLVFHKKSSPTESIDYESAVLEALCFGWIDSKMQRIDSERHRQYYSVRKPDSTWSGLNKRRVTELEGAGLMTRAGKAAVDVAKGNGAWEFLDEIEALVVPGDLAEALDASRGAREAYDDFSASKKRAVLFWIKQTKRATTRASRIATTAEAASRGKTPLDQ
ncbi:MAG: hypothetical protein HKN80_02000 [Acidimicrobiia bacterium]|nr:hypothetical protein [Acidimicrobiia bacterium]